MGRKVKCKYCSELGTSDTFYKLSEGNKNKYFCNKNEADQYLQAELKRKEQNELRSEALTYIHDEVLEYQEKQLLPKYIIKRTSELSEFYPWQVIKGCFKMKRKAIQLSMQTKEFNNEHFMAKYIMAIVERVINDVNALWKHRQVQLQERELIINNIQMDVYENMSTEQINIKKENKDISEFLDEEDD